MHTRLDFLVTRCPSPAPRVLVRARPRSLCPRLSPPASRVARALSSTPPARQQPSKCEGRDLDTIPFRLMKTEKLKRHNIHDISRHPTCSNSTTPWFTNVAMLIVSATSRRSSRFPWPETTGSSAPVPEDAAGPTLTSRGAVPRLPRGRRSRRAAKAPAPDGGRTVGPERSVRARSRLSASDASAPHSSGRGRPAATGLPTPRRTSRRRVGRGAGGERRVAGLELPPPRGGPTGTMVSAEPLQRGREPVYALRCPGSILWVAFLAPSRVQRDGAPAESRACACKLNLRGTRRGAVRELPPRRAASLVSTR